MGAHRLAIVGLGRMGSTIDREIRGYSAVTVPFSLASSARALPNVEILAGCDIVPSRLKAFEEDWGVRATYDDYERMLRQERPDMVAICTPAAWHAEMTQAAAEAGAKMIYCEKAMACSLREADAARRAVVERGVAYNTGVLRRFDERFRHARRLIDAGRIGRVQAIVHYAPATLVHGHIHAIDTILFLAGDRQVRSVWGELRPRNLVLNNDRLERDPLAVYHLELEDGIEATTIPAGNWEFEIVGEEGVLRGMNNGATWTLRRTLDDDSTFERIELAAPSTSATVACLQDLIAAREESRETAGHVATAHHALEVCMAVAESHRQEARVGVPLVSRELYVNHY